MRDYRLYVKRPPIKAYYSYLFLIGNKMVTLACVTVALGASPPVTSLRAFGATGRAMTRQTATPLSTFYFRKSNGAAQHYDSKCHSVRC